MNIRGTVRQLINEIRPATRKFNGRVLPAPHLRLCGDYFKDDQNFIDSATAEAERLISRFDLTKDDVVLDLGCGYGRLAFGLLEKLPKIQNYYGIDVNLDAIKWCQRYISSSHKNFKFIHTDVENPRYNPDGSIDNTVMTLPLSNESVNLVYLYSVFSHMLIKDVTSYLGEFYRLLATKGQVFLTAFVEDNVEDMVENPPGYLRHKWHGPLHCVRYRRDYFESIIAKAGFEIVDFIYASETHGQSSYHLRKL